MKFRVSLIAAAICGVTASTQASLVAWYTFDEGAGATTSINSVGGNNGTISSGVTTGVGGVSGNAYQFDDSTGYVDMGNASFFSSINSNAQLSYSVWINTSVTVGQRNVVVFAGNNTVGDRYTDLGYSATGDGGSGIIAGGAYARNRSAGNGINAASTSAVNNGEWHHLAMTIDLTTASFILYVDGELAGSQTLTELSFPLFNTFQVGRLGRGGNGPTDYYGGLIDEVQVYDTALSAQDVLFLANNPGAAVPEPSAFALAGLGFCALFFAHRRRLAKVAVRA